jgi:hypothetical protein
LLQHVVELLRFDVQRTGGDVLYAGADMLRRDVELLRSSVERHCGAGPGSGHNPGSCTRSLKNVFSWRNHRPGSRGGRCQESPVVVVADGDSLLELR